MIEPGSEEAIVLSDYLLAEHHDKADWAMRALRNRAEINHLRAALLNIQALAERGFPIDCAKLAGQCRRALTLQKD